MEDSKDEMIRKACESVGDKVNPVTKKALEGVMHNIFSRGMVPREALGLSPAAVENIYGHAYRMYTAGQYNEAQHLFRLLVMLDPGESKFLLGSAACYHLNKEYETAATTYALVSMADPKTPIPHYHAADCYIKIGLIGSAIHELKTTIEKCGENAPYAVIRDRANMMLERLESGDIKEGEVESEQASPIDQNDEEKYA